MTSGILHGNCFGISTVSFTFDPASVAANTSSEQTVTITGLKTTDIILKVTKPTHTAGFFIGGARASAANTLAIQTVNCTASAIDAASETYTVTVLRLDAPVSTAVSF